MIAGPSPDVAVIGAGIVGCSIAYYLSRAGADVTLVERLGVAGGASGNSAGGLNPLEGDHIPGPLAELSIWSYRLHLDLWRQLPEDTSVAFSERIVPWIRIALSENDLPDLQRSFRAFSRVPGFSARMLDSKQVLEIEPRISDAILGGVYMYGNAAVDSRCLTLALMTAAEERGARFVWAAGRPEPKVSRASLGVVAGSEKIAAGTVVVAAGPWSGRALELAGVRLPIRPVKGEILRIDPPGPMYRQDIAYPGGEAHPKPDGLVWIGATAEEDGFDTRVTDAARRTLTADAVRAIPSLADSTVALQTACLRPTTSDGLPAIGRVGGRHDLYVATGGGKKGVLLGPAMGRAIADLILDGHTGAPIVGFGPDRFG